MSKTRLGYIFFIMVILFSCTAKASWKPMFQQESVKFPRLGVLEVTVQAVEEELPKLVISNAAKKVLLQLEMGYPDEQGGSDDSFRYGAGIEFQVRHIPGLPDPLLMVVTAGSGGSAGRLDVALIGVVSGALKLLWKEGAYDPGGFFVGDLGKKRGVGIAQWYWSSSECRACPADEYFVELYLWNREKAQFDVGPQFTFEKKRFNSVKKLGLDFPDQIGDFERIWNRFKK